MNNAASCGCPLDITFMKNIFKTTGIVTKQIAGKDIGQGFESAMRMIVHIAIGFWWYRPGFVKQEKRIDMTQRLYRKGTTDVKAAAFDLMFAIDRTNKRTD